MLIIRLYNPSLIMGEISPQSASFNRTMDRWRGKVAIITGASAGIGEAIAESLVEEGLLVAGFTRFFDRTEEISKKLQHEKGKLYGVKVDITKEEDIIKGFKWVTENLGPVHILINNAGIIQDTNLIEGDTTKWRQVLDTNILSLCIATREAVKIMKANNIDGHIIHVNSVCGHQVPFFPNVNVFPASKHAVTALTETLRQEFTRYNLKIKISSVSPGAVFTEIVQASINKSLNSDFTEMLKTMPMLESKDVAQAVCYILSTPPHVQVHEIIVKPLGETF